MPAASEIGHTCVARDLLALVAVEEGHQIELLIGRAVRHVEVLHDHVWRESGASQDRDQRETDAVAAASALVAAVDQFAAKKRRVGLEIEVEIVWTPRVVEGAGDGDGFVALAEARAEDGERIG